MPRLRPTSARALLLPVLLATACAGSAHPPVACPAIAVRPGIGLDVTAYQAAVGHPVAASLCVGTTCSLRGELFVDLQGRDGQVVHLVVRVAGGPTSATDVTLRERGTHGCRFGVAGQARLDAAGVVHEAP
ncbi:MAG: hypothetical protein ACXVGH_03840 [Mycobacteriales bacterium]